MSHAEVSPSDAVSDDELSDPDPEGDPSDGSETSITDMLLSTEPEDSPVNHPEKPPWMAHALIGLKKALNAAMSADLRSGTTALENFAFAALGIALSGTGDSDTNDSGKDNVDEQPGLVEPEEFES
jgi:hypothetical protein